MWDKDRERNRNSMGKEESQKQNLEAGMVNKFRYICFVTFSKSFYFVMFVFITLPILFVTFIVTFLTAPNGSRTSFWFGLVLCFVTIVQK